MVKVTTNTTSLGDDEVVRLKDGPKFFGLGRTKIRELVAAGKIPKPIHFSERCVGWYGRQIHEYQRRVAAEKK
jgi:predicted DNA-binding transcriptional regulator AlpA